MVAWGACISSDQKEPPPCLYCDTPSVQKKQTLCALSTRDFLAPPHFPLPGTPGISRVGQCRPGPVCVPRCCRLHAVRARHAPPMPIATHTFRFGKIGIFWQLLSIRDRQPPPPPRRVVRGTPFDPSLRPCRPPPPLTAPGQPCVVPGVRGRAGRPAASSKPLKTRRRLPRPYPRPLYLAQRLCHCCVQFPRPFQIKAGRVSHLANPCPSAPQASGRPPIKQSQWEADYRQWRNARFAISRTSLGNSGCV